MLSARAKIGLAVGVTVVFIFILPLMMSNGDDAGGYIPADIKRIRPHPKVKDEFEDPLILKIVRSKGVSYNLASHDISHMSASEREHTMHSILDNTDTVCKRKLRMGKIGDGGWEICDDEDVRPKRPCIVYSFGINNDFSFDDDVALNYGCHVYSFDPSMEVLSHNRSDLVNFYKVGISGTRETRGEWQLEPFSHIRRMLGHWNNTVDIVKMDVEGSEWGVITNMAASGELRKLKQILLEFHLHGHMEEHHLEVVKVLELEGFKKFYTHKNPACGRKVQDFPGSRSICYEVHYVRRPTKGD